MSHTSLVIHMQDFISNMENKSHNNPIDMRFTVWYILHTFIVITCQSQKLKVVALSSTGFMHTYKLVNFACKITENFDWAVNT